MNLILILRKLWKDLNEHESRNTEGSGLGLAIARDLVSLQGGNMSIDIDGDLFKVKVVMDEYPQQILLQK